jgi:hypothetical protein
MAPRYSFTVSGYGLMQTIPVTVDVTTLMYVYQAVSLYMADISA